ncbi:MAG: hypothetical protein GKC05_04275 [Methanomicrobiales archaeon]|nr:hypothetical protein [Methanomicrobiales archaeon]NYT21233.1 hypothetical protein [Methanomicrobiales archaeon]
MTPRRLFIFVEGSDDRRFFSRVIVPLLGGDYASVEIITYASMKSVKVCRFVRSITAMDHDFIMCGDIDQERNVKAKKAVLKSRFCVLSDDRIVIIIQEIESWYLAGLDERSQRRLALRSYRTTNHITKEMFNHMIPRFYTSRIAFMADILDLFSIGVALEKNRSFTYFFTRFITPSGIRPGTVRPESASSVKAGTIGEKTAGEGTGAGPGESGTDEISAKPVNNTERREGEGL